MKGIFEILHDRRALDIMVRVSDGSYPTVTEVSTSDNGKVHSARHRCIHDLCDAGILEMYRAGNERNRKRLGLTDKGWKILNHILAIADLEKVVPFTDSFLECRHCGARLGFDEPDEDGSCPYCWEGEGFDLLTPVSIDDGHRTYPQCPPKVRLTGSELDIDGTIVLRLFAEDGAFRSTLISILANRDVVFGFSEDGRSVTMTDISDRPVLDGVLDEIAKETGAVR